MLEAKKIQNLLRKTVSDTQTYSWLRRLYVLQIYLTGRPHEECYRALPHLAADKGVFLDIGANAGQTAAAVARLLPRHQIICVEPNPALHREIAFTQRLVGDRMTVVARGLAAEAGRVDLFVPHAGALDFEARASLSECEARKHAAELQSRLDRQISVRKCSVDVTTLDALDVRPDVIKIDVEGVEHEVLRGAQATLSSSRPVVLFERNKNIDECERILRDLDYVLNQDQLKLADEKAHPLGNMVVAIPSSGRESINSPKIKSGSA